MLDLLESGSPGKGRLASCGALRDTPVGMSTNRSHLQLPPAQVAEFCQRHHIRKLAVFGSALHGDARPDSDLDVLVEFEPGHVPGLFLCGDGAGAVRAARRRKVDLNTPLCLSRHFRDECCRSRTGICRSMTPTVRLQPHAGRTRAKRRADGAIRTGADLDADRTLSLATLRCLEIVGEAASHIPASLRQQHPQIPWPQIIGMRNRLVHGYDLVDYDIIWQHHYRRPSAVNCRVREDSLNQLAHRSAARRQCAMPGLALDCHRRDQECQE